MTATGCLDCALLLGMRQPDCLLDALVLSQSLDVICLQTETD